MITILKNTTHLKQRAFYHACLFATFSLYWTVVPILLRTSLLYFTNTEIALFGFVSIAGVLFTPTIGKLADKSMIDSLTTISMLLVVLSVLLLLFVKNHSILTIILLIISGIILDVGISGNLLLGQKVIYSLDVSIRSRLNGLYMTIFFLGGAFGSFIGTYSYYKFSINTALMIGLVLPLIALVVHIINIIKSSNSNKQSLTG
ncbi:MFS transporter [Clostridium akagii]|uniref:MFS transporter n=1 Tax=Clostridium akagii TaxID=91623 RepID=UPI00068BC2F6|nr:MFS transporter [Clostridium akagii]